MSSNWTLRRTHRDITEYVHQPKVYPFQKLTTTVRTSRLSRST
jgi:hypothetical protein